jgi:ribosome-binding protein aMBF1 (putative translation factor)
MRQAQTIKLGKTEYVIIPKAEYLRLQGKAGIPAGSVEAADYARASIGATLKAAREHAGLTQADLAERLGKSQPMVSGAESGSISVSDRYVATVLKACRLPKDWTGPKAK